MIENEIELNSAQENEVSQEPQNQVQEETTSHDEQVVKQEPKPAETPFHEHPRFKELVEQKNQYASQLSDMQRQFAEMQRQMQEASRPKPEKKADPMVERLKGIDPEFADYIASLKEQASSSDSIREELRQLKEQQFVDSAVTKVRNLHGENKVSDKLKPIYEAEMDRRYSKGELRTLGDIEKAYKEVHAFYTDLLAEKERDVRASYTSAKKTDAKAPATQPKGQVAKPAQKSPYTGDAYTDRATMIKRAISQDSADESF